MIGDIVDETGKNNIHDTELVTFGERYYPLPASDGNTIYHGYGYVQFGRIFYKTTIPYGMFIVTVFCWMS